MPAKTSSSPKVPEIAEEKDVRRAIDSPIKSADGTSSVVDTELVRKAVTALIQHHNSISSKPELLGNDTFVQVLLGLEVPPKVLDMTPIRVSIPHSFRQFTSDGESKSHVNIEDVDVCLIVKDDAKAWIKEMIELFPDELKCIKKVLRLTSLRKKFGQFQQRRELLNTYDVFFAQDRIWPMMPSALGKNFYKSKKLPIPINLNQKKALPSLLQKALNSTYMTVPKGTCVTIVAGKTNMPIDHLVENVIAVANHAPGNVPRKWANIKSIHIKTPDSTALPFYNKTPFELKELAELSGLKPVWKATEKVLKSKVAGDKDKSNVTNKKRKKDIKSPLVQALKKHKLNQTISGTEATSGKNADTNMVSGDESGKKGKAFKNSDFSAHSLLLDDSSNVREVAQVGTKRTKAKKGTHSSSGNTTSSVVKVTEEMIVEDSNEAIETKTTKVVVEESTKTDESLVVSKKTRKNKVEQLVLTGDDVAAHKNKAIKAKNSTDFEKRGSNVNEQISKKSTVESPADRSKEKEEKREVLAVGSIEHVAVSVIDKNSKVVHKLDKEIAKPSKNVKSSQVNEESKDFLPAKQYKGSKSGYVFKQGDKGLGYYIDIKPVVNTMALEALLRSSKEKGKMPRNKPQKRRNRR